MGNRHQDSEQDRIRQRAEKTRILRLSGLSWARIAEIQDIGVDTARKDWERMQVDYPMQTTRELIAEQKMKLDLISAPQLKAAMKGDRKACETMIRILDHEAKLMRLYTRNDDSSVSTAESVIDKLEASAIAVLNKIGGAGASDD